MKSTKIKIGTEQPAKPPSFRPRMHSHGGPWDREWKLLRNRSISYSNSSLEFAFFGIGIGIGIGIAIEIDPDFQWLLTCYRLINNCIDFNSDNTCQMLDKTKKVAFGKANFAY